jgi:hypothetical protein
VATFKYPLRHLACRNKSSIWFHLQKKKSSDLRQCGGIIAMEEFHAANFGGFCLLICEEVSV